MDKRKEVQFNHVEKREGALLLRYDDRGHRAQEVLAASVVQVHVDGGVAGGAVVAQVIDAENGLETIGAGCLSNNVFAVRSELSGTTVELRPQLRSQSRHVWAR